MQEHEQIAKLLMHDREIARLQNAVSELRPGIIPRTSDDRSTLESDAVEFLFFVQHAHGVPYEVWNRLCEIRRKHGLV